jgi:hypothetical protein
MIFRSDRLVSSVSGVLALALLFGCSSSAQPDSITQPTSTYTGGTGGAASTGGAGGAGAEGGAGGAPGYDYCVACNDPSVHGAIQDSELDTASGLAASRLHTGVYYSHNDEADDPRFFATNLLGEELGRYELTGAEHVDWEDCAVAACGSDSCLYLADVGDSTGVRTTYAVYRTTEPANVAAGTVQVTYERFPFEYPDGAHDANTLLVHPESGEMVVITTVFGGPSSAYRFPMPLQADTVVTLEAIGSVEPPSGSPELTAGDVHPDGLGMLLRSRTHLFFLPMADGGIANSLDGALCSMPRADESQGESVAWSASGDGYASVGEGFGSSFSFVNCP